VAGREEATATREGRGGLGGSTRGSPQVNRVTTLSLRFLLGLTLFDPLAEMRGGAIL
jgi:hypothetical protein